MNFIGSSLGVLPEDALEFLMKVPLAIPPEFSSENYLIFAKKYPGSYPGVPPEVRQEFVPLRYSGSFARSSSRKNRLEFLHFWFLHFWSSTRSSSANFLRVFPEDLEVHPQVSPGVTPEGVPILNWL